jgi:hypothetical protein
MKKVSYKGALWCPVRDAARYLRTNAADIRVLMGSGDLAYTQLRPNRPLYVSVSDLVKIQTHKMAEKYDRPRSK